MAGSSGELWARYGPSPWKQRVLDRLLAAVLNYLDFITDVLVLLEYGCYSTLQATCDHIPNWTETNASTLDTYKVCEPHWWWFGISLTILVVSTCLQAFLYALDKLNKSCCAGCGVFLCGLLQLSYARDLCKAIMCSHDKTEDDAILRRDIFVKVFECAPQLYLQSYILFAIQAHGDPLKVFSTVISASSMAHGITRFFSTVTVATLKLRFHQKLAIGLFLATDQLLRASGYALVLSPAARPIGVPMMLVFGVLSWGLIHKAYGTGGGVATLVFTLFIAVVGGHVVPIFPLNALIDTTMKTALKGSECWKQLYLRWALAPRFLEMVLCGIIGWTVAKTACGSTPTVEVGSFFGLLAVNFMFLLVMLWCMNDCHPVELNHSESPVPLGNAQVHPEEPP